MTRRGRTAGDKGRSPRIRRKRYGVFLSHSSRDLWIAQVMKEKLERLKGVDVWLDKMSIQGGDDVRKAVENGIAAAAETVVLVSQEALRSLWVPFEIGIATGKRRRVTPVLNNVEAKELGPLQGTKSVELNEFESFMGELSRRVNRKNEGVR